MLDLENSAAEFHQLAQSIVVTLADRDAGSSQDGAAEAGDLGTFALVIQEACNALETCLDQPGFDASTARVLQPHIVRTQATIKRLQDRFLSVEWRAVPRSWRVYSTDATILYVTMSCAVLISTKILGGTKELNGDKPRDTLLDLIRALDVCLIATSAPGRDRRECIYSLLTSLQRLHALIATPNGKSQAHGADVTEERPPKRPRVEVSQESTLPTWPVRATGKVLELPGEPDLETFLSRYRERPFIVRRWAEDWPAMQPHICSDESEVQPQFNPRWASRSYLETLSGVGRVVPVEIGRAYTDATWTQAIVGWDHFLDHAGWTRAGQAREGEGLQPGDTPTTIYLAQHSLLVQFPQMERDMIRPDLLYSCPPAPSWMLEYKAPVDEESGDEVIVNAWIGPAGTTSPAHTDPYHNLFVQVIGHKQFWLAPPDADEHGAMYHFSAWDNTSSANAGSEAEEPDATRHSAAAFAHMDNTSQLDVFEAVSAVTGDKEATGTASSSGHDPFPLFTEHVEPKALSSVLGPGDMLYIPPKWWHAVKSLSKSISMSHFF